jgi:hypothetical protein
VRSLISSVALSCAALAAMPSPARPQASRSRLFYSFHVGSAHPLGALDSLTDANIHVHIDWGYELARKTDDARVFNAKLMVGFNQFTAEIPTGIPHPHWTNVSLNLQMVTPPTGTGLRGYLQAGGGVYIPKSGSSSGGFNAGIGAQVPMAAPFRLEFGIDIHQIQTKPSTRFATIQLGVLFR